MLELDDRLHRFAAHHFGGILVNEVIAALDRVVHVPLPMVFLHVAESGADATLGGAGVGAGGVELAQHGDVAQPGALQGGHQAGATSADDDRVVAMKVRHGSLKS